MEHVLITKSRIEYKKQNPNQFTNNLTIPHRGELIKMKVSKSSIDRTLKFIEILFKGIVDLGYELKFIENSSVLLMNDEVIKFRIREQTKRVENKNSKYSWREFEYIPTGILIFEVEIDGEKSWKDGKIKIEDRIEEIIKYFNERTKDLHKENIRIDRHKREDEIIRWIQLKKQVRTEEELVRIKELFEESQRFEISSRIRNYIKHIEENKIKSDKWIKWSNGIIDWYDPSINKKNEILKNVDKSVLELKFRYKSYINNRYIDIEEGDENEMFNELLELYDLDIEEDKKNKNDNN